LILATGGVQGDFGCAAVLGSCRAALSNRSLKKRLGGSRMVGLAAAKVVGIGL